MTVETITAVLLIAVPIAFNLAFFELCIALLIGTLEFVGPNERDGWHLAGIIVSIAYIAWSLWLIVIGVLLLV